MAGVDVMGYFKDILESHLLTQVEDLFYSFPEEWLSGEKDFVVDVFHYKVDFSELRFGTEISVPNRLLGTNLEQTLALPDVTKIKVSSSAEKKALKPLKHYENIGDNICESIHVGWLNITDALTEMFNHPLTNIYVDGELFDTCVVINIFDARQSSESLRQSDFSAVEIISQDDDNSGYSPSLLQRYSYKPSPIFFGEGVHLGVELEIDSFEWVEFSDAVDAAVALDYAYLKEDGSLQSGFEIVTHPATMEEHMKRDWAGILPILEKCGFDMSPQTAGLHVHVGRAGLGSTQDAQELCISKILYLFEKFWKDIVVFSRRTEAQLSRWAKRYNLDISDIPDMSKKAKSQNNRYFAVNLENKETIEFRVFAGTLDPEIFFRTLAFVHNIVDICKNKTIKEIQKISWNDLLP